MKSEAAGRAAHQGLAGRLILFDLDGTLVDSTPGIWASVRVAAAELGRPEPTPDQLRGMSAPRWRTASPSSTPAGVLTVLRIGGAAGAGLPGRRAELIRPAG